MVHIVSCIAVLAFSFVVVQAMPIQDEMAGIIHAQSFSELKHEAFVPMQKLGHDGFPIKNNKEQDHQQQHARVSAAFFNPIMVVPLPGSVTRQEHQEISHRISASANNNNNSNNGKMLVDISDKEKEEDEQNNMMRVPNMSNNHHDHSVLGMDDQGDIKTIQLPATIHMPVAPSASASAIVSVQPSASVSSAPSSAMAKIALPKPSAPAVSAMMKNRKHVVGMDDMGKLQTLAVPMTTGNSGMVVAPTPASRM